MCGYTTQTPLHSWLHTCTSVYNICLRIPKVTHVIKQEFIKVIILGKILTFMVASRAIGETSYINKKMTCEQIINNIIIITIITKNAKAYSTIVSFAQLTISVL